MSTTLRFTFISPSADPAVVNSSIADQVLTYLGDTDELDFHVQSVDVTPHRVFVSGEVSDWKVDVVVNVRSYGFGGINRPSVSSLVDQIRGAQR